MVPLPWGALATATASLASPEQRVPPTLCRAHLPEPSAMGVCNYSGCSPVLQAVSGMLSR